MEPIEGSETSTIKPQTTGKYPKENILHILWYIGEEKKPLPIVVVYSRVEKNKKNNNILKSRWEKNTTSNNNTLQSRSEKNPSNYNNLQSSWEKNYVQL